MKAYLKQNKILCVILLVGLCYILSQIMIFFVTGKMPVFLALAYPDDIDHWSETIPYDFFWDMVEGSSVECADILDGTKVVQMNQGPISSGFCGNLIGVTKTVGLGLLLMYFLTELIDKITKEQFDTEALIRMLIKYLAVESLFNSIPQIINALFTISNELAIDVSTANIQNTYIMDNIASILRNSGIMADMLITVLIFLPWLLSKIMGLVVQAVCWSRLIDIILRGGFTPIGCASMAQDGFAGNGFRYLKRFFGSCLQGVIIAGILKLSGQISAVIFASGLFGTTSTVALIGAVVGMLIVNFIQIMCIVKSGQFANEIAGA